MTDDIPKGTWVKAGGYPFRPKIVGKQVELLEQLRGILELEQTALLKKLTEAREALARVKHGGGA